MSALTIADRILQVLNAHFELSNREVFHKLAAQAPGEFSPTQVSNALNRLRLAGKAACECVDGVHRWSATVPVAVTSAPAEPDQPASDAPEVSAPEPSPEAEHAMQTHNPGHDEPGYRPPKEAVAVVNESWTTGRDTADHTPEPAGEPAVEQAATDPHRLAEHLAEYEEAERLAALTAAIDTHLPTWPGSRRPISTAELLNMATRLCLLDDGDRFTIFEAFAEGVAYAEAYHGISTKRQGTA